MASSRGPEPRTGEAHAPASRPRLLRRLASLRDLEAANVALFWGIYAFARADAEPSAAWAFRTYGLALVSFVLVVGAAYWHLKGRSLRRKRPLPSGFRRTFTRLRTLDLVLLATTPALAALLLALGRTDPADLVVGALLVAFAALEHVNYFHVQLMHDSRADWAYLLRNRRLRRAPLADDLRRAP